MIQFDYSYRSVEEFAEEFRSQFRDPELCLSGWDRFADTGAVLLRITPGDMTEYVIGVQSITFPNIIGLSLFSPYRRAGIVPIDAKGDYLLDKLQIDERDRRYPGLLTILETVVGAIHDGVWEANR